MRAGATDHDADEPRRSAEADGDEDDRRQTGRDVSPSSSSFFFVFFILLLFFSLLLYMYGYVEWNESTWRDTSSGLRSAPRLSFVLALTAQTSENPYHFFT